ncbi:MAG: SgcJ/EcaC family oxidoreductase [Phycisphaerae bacterium]|jgi:beta-aspartyl-peptidase (threonine type)
MRTGRTLRWAGTASLLIVAGGVLAQIPPAETRPADALRSALERVLAEQAEAWNRGDIDAFMEHYWNSDDLTFSSGGRTTRGWQATLERYKKKYDTREKMGTLRFDTDFVRPLGDAAALLLGRWRLELPSGETPGGNFTLVFQKFDGRWLIVHDHTSALPAGGS